MINKTEEKYVDETLGFPVVVRNMPMEEFRGEYAPAISPDRLAIRVLWKLATAEYSLTGDQIRFVRHWLDETLEQFAAPLDVSPPAVTKWEKKGEAPTGMTRGTEFQIRARIVRELQELEEISENVSFAYIFDEMFEFDPNVEFEQVELVCSWKSGKKPGRTTGPAAPD